MKRKSKRKSAVGVRQSKILEFGGRRGGMRVEKSKFPLYSLCVSCGKEKQLSWIVGGRHLCAECKDYYTKV